MTVIGLIAAYIAIAAADFSVLSKQKKRLKVMAVYFTLIALGLAVSLAFALDYEPTSPSVIIEKAIFGKRGG